MDKQQNSLKDNAGLTVEDLIEIEMQVTQVNVASEILLELLHKKREKYVNEKLGKSEEETKKFFESIASDK